MITRARGELLGWRRRAKSRRVVPDASLRTAVTFVLVSCETLKRFELSQPVIVRNVASGGVKVVEIGRLEINVFEAGFLLGAGAPRPGYRRKMAEEDISTEVG